MATIYLSLGTNLGDRQGNLERAVDALSGLVTITTVSSVYDTAPWGPNPDQPNFLNLCVAATTDLSPSCLLVALGQMEARIGRKNHDRWQPHHIDIDLIFYDNLVVEYGGKKIPHRQIEERAFVLVPLLEIAPDLFHPETGASIAELTEIVDKSGIQNLSLTMAYAEVV